MNAALALAASALLAQRPMPLQPPSAIQTYQPDQQACTPERLLAGYRQGLSAYADQPPAVLEKLRGLQRQLTARSLKVCLEKGLLPPEQVERLIETMGLAVPMVAPQPAATPDLAPPQPAQRRPEPPKPATLQPAMAQPAVIQPAAAKPAVGKPEVINGHGRPSSSLQRPSFDMSPLELNPAPGPPIEPQAQEDPSSAK